MIVLFGFAFLSGFVTILAPCIWPVLPIVLSSSLAGKGGHQRPLGVTLGVMLSFAVFTLSISTLVRLFHFDPNSLRIIAVVVIAILGLTMIIPALSARFEVLVSRLSGIFGSNTQRGKGFLPGFITGLSLGIVWSPCAGPILATIAALAATGKVSLDVVVITLAYVIGVGIPLFAFAYGGQQLLVRTKGIAKYTGRIQQVFGCVMILAAIAIFTNYDQVLQVDLLNMFPQLNTALNGFETSQTVQDQLHALTGNQTTQGGNNSDLFNTNTPAPDFVGITKWLNLPAGQTSVSLKDLKGKVVLVDFWTYTCINCIRTLPHVTTWYDKYKDQGFVVIGIHTPEFQFEHDTNNVLNAIKMDNIHYPVGQDNNYATWNNYNNQYWPAEYLIDANGNIRRTDFGEGEYAQTEMAIQELLKEAGRKVSSTLSDMPDQTPTTTISPETYLGSARMQFYYPSSTLGNGNQTFTLSPNLPQSTFSYGGSWGIADEDAQAGKNATLNYHFVADKVYIILRPGATANGRTVSVFLDGKPISSSVAGSDVKNGVITVTTDRLYNVVDLHGKTEEHTLELDFTTPGLQAFTFTFG